LSRGADALLIYYGLRPAFSTYTQEELMACMSADTFAASQAMWQERSYERVELNGKCMAHKLWYKACYEGQDDVGGLAVQGGRP
jgi:hypothetical protein